MTIVAIVVTYNGAKWVDKCFGSLVNSTVPLCILAIDNASTDNTVNLIKQKFPTVEVIETGANLGFGKANNIGFKKALLKDADYVFMLNQDAWIETNTVAVLANIAGKNKDYGIVSPFHLLPGHAKLEWHFSTYISPEKCKDLYSDIYFRKAKDIYSLEFVNAAAWLVSKEAILQVGGFDPVFPHYGEDDDYCSRVIYKKFKIGVVPAAVITHDISMKSWEEIKVIFQRQLIFCFIELKNIRYTFNNILVNYIISRLKKLFSLLMLRKWRELFLMARVFLVSITYFSKISNSRKIAKQPFSYLN